MEYLLSRASRRILEQLVQEGALCAFDFDGTLSPIVEHPDQAEMRVRTRDLLTGVKCRMLGVLLNAVDSSAPDYYYSYRYYPYAYGGYSQEEKESKKTAASA